ERDSEMSRGWEKSATFFCFRVPIRALGFDALEWLMLIAAVLLLSTVALVIYQHTSCAMKTISAGGSLLLLTILLAGCQTDSVSSLTPHGGYMTRVNDPARCPPAKVAKVNRAALGLTLLGEPQRMAVFQDRLRGLCEVATVKQLSADSWRASCAEDSSF